MKGRRGEKGAGTRRGRLAVVGLLLLAALAAAGYSVRDALREKWLQRQSTEDLRQLDAQENADALVHFVYARRLFDTGAAADARGPAASAVAALPKPAHTGLAARIFALAGCLAADDGDDRKAEDYLQRAESIRRDDLFVCLGRGTLAMRQEQAADAVDVLTRATRIDAACVEAWERLGRAYLLGAEPDLAVQALRRAANLSPKDPMIHVDLGQGLLQLKQFSEAEAEYRTVAALVPDNLYYSTLPLRVAAFSARTEADYAHAVDLLHTALNRHPENDGLRAELAGIHMRFSQFGPARQELETILTHNPVISADCWYNLYTVCKRMGDSHAADSARTHFREVAALKRSATVLSEQAQLRPNDARLYLRLSNTLLRLGKVEEAYAALTRAAALDPHDPEIARSMEGAQVYLRTQQGAAAPSGRGGMTQ